MRANFADVLASAAAVFATLLSCGTASAHALTYSCPSGRVTGQRVDYEDGRFDEDKDGTSLPALERLSTELIRVIFDGFPPGLKSALLEV